MNENVSENQKIIARIVKTILVIFSVLCIFVSHSLAFRCNNGIVEVGDSGTQLILKCGQPNQKLHLGYTVTSEGKRKLIVEKWIYGPISGTYYEIILEGDQITEINMFRKQIVLARISSDTHPF